jgi:hypothetical protein
VCVEILCGKKSMNAETLLDKLDESSVPALSNKDFMESLSQGTLMAATIANADGQAPTDNSLCQQLAESMNPDIRVDITYDNAPDQPKENADFDITFNNTLGLS